VGGKELLAVRDPAELRKLVYRLHVPAGRLPAGEALAIDLEADSPTPIHYTVAAAGVQRQDEVGPVGDAIKLHRRLETLDGKPVEGRLRVGDVVAVRLTVELTGRQEYLLLEDRRPAGCEFADEQVGGAACGLTSHFEFRDDRVCVYFGALPAGRHEVVYYLRAETPGVSHVLPGCAYPMYAESVRGETGADRLEVAPPEGR
jgi:uncharacterized protein YfaS (alpha-2-macroglobulin family)